MEPKKWWLVIALLILILVSCSSKDEISSGAKTKKVCDMSAAKLPVITFLGQNNRYTIFGQFCSLMFEFVEYDGDYAVIRVYESPLKSREIRIAEGGRKFIQEGIIIHAFSFYSGGIRAGISSTEELDPPDQEEYITACFQNPFCNFICEDFNGVRGECPNGTVPVANLPFSDRFNDKDCCINYLFEPILVPTKKVYYKDEFLQVYFFGTESTEDCVVYLIDPNGKQQMIESFRCPSFRSLINYNLLRNFGETYGNWRIKAFFEDNRTFETGFEYRSAALIFKRFLLPYHGEVNISLLGENISIQHIDGCGNEIKVKMPKEAGIKVGENVPISQRLFLILEGASCKDNGARLLIRKVSEPVCPNSYCEIGETQYSCPWDCLNPTEVDHAEPIISPELCSLGCFYDGKCLAQDYRVKIQGKIFICDRKVFKDGK